MKRIIFVDNYKVEDEKRMVSALEAAGLKYELSSSSKAVIVYGDNDALYFAKQALVQAGFELL